ncbi:hypothetical protein PRIC1_010114 [Phytophthora ramorum]
MRTRASDAKLQKNEEAENALGEVMQQLGDEDKEGELSDSGDSDYEDEGAGAARPAKTSKGIVLRGNADEDSVASEGVDDSDEDAETEAGSSSGKDAEEMEVSSSNEESASSVSQKRNRKGHRKSPRKAARTATTLSPRDGSDAEDGAFVEGFPCRWSSWEDFHRTFEEFQGATYQQFSSRTSTSVSSRNNQMRNAVAREAKTTGEDAAVMETRKGKQYIPESWVKYCKILRCTHGRTQAARGSGKRKHRLFITLKASGYHNHPVTKHQWFNYAENRTITDEGLTRDVHEMHKAGAHAKGILAYLCEQSGKLVALRDVHNMIQRFKKEQRAGQTDAERALASLDEFSAEKSEEKPNLRIAVKCFQKHNPAWTDIRVLVTDKAMHEKAVLREAFPQARQLLCQWHVIMWLKKQATRLAASHKKEVKGLMKALVYSRNREEYQDAKYALLETLGGDVEHPMYKFFICNWDNTQEEWVSYKRGNIAHLGNNTNNRLECKWGKIKKVLEPHFTLDETILTLITLQRLAEDEYIAQYHEVGSRPHLGEDPELAALGMQLSEYAFTLVAEQHAFAVGPKADYGIDLSVPGKATLTRAGTGRLHVVDTSVRMQ